MLSITKLTELVSDEAVPVMIEAYERHEPVYPRIARVVPISRTDRNRLGRTGDVMTGLGRLQERPPGGEIEAGEPRMAYRWYMRHRFFDKKVGFAVEELEAADAWGKIGDTIMELAESAGQVVPTQKDDALAAVFQKGTLTAGSKVDFDGTFPGYTDPNPKFIYDGLPFFDTTHTQAVGGNTFSNHIAAAALAESTLETAHIRMTVTNAFDDKNERVVIRPNTLLVPPQLEHTAQVLVQTPAKPGTAQNDVNVFRGKYDVISWNALTDDTDAWWLGEARQGVLFADYGQPTMNVWEDPNTRTVWVAVHCEWGVAVTNWRYWMNNNKAAA